MVESIASVPFCPACQQVVRPKKNRLQKLRSHPAIGAIGRHKERHRLHPEQQKQHKESQDDPPHNRMGTAKAKTVALPQARHHILHHTQRTHHRTIDASQEQRDQQKHDDNHYVERQNGRQQLYFGRPPQIMMQRACKVQKKQRDAYKKQRGQNDSYLS